MTQMQNVNNWLSELGLEKYIAIFEEAEIDFEVLEELDENDLKELGLPLGPRRKILKALVRSSTVEVVPEKTLEATHRTAAERRHLTVMFVDLANSTQLSTRLDAEDMRTLITGYQNTVAGIIGRFEGFTAKFMGDGVLCYFGWPRASEDDAERAVRAGLSIINTVAKMQAPDGSSLATRIGLAAGVVIVGDLVGTGASQEAAVIGETPNLAARLQSCAGLNELVISRDMEPLLGGAFEVKALGERELKGIRGLVEVLVVKAETTSESRFAARQSGAITSIVGRDQDIEFILERWALTRSGQGQFVLVNGEAGIGKSRITRAVIDQTAEDDRVRITYQCSPYHTESAFYPLIQQLSFAAGFTQEDTVDQRLDKVEALIGAENETMAFVVSMLGLDGVARYGAITLTPEQQRTKLMKVLVELLIYQAQSKPVLLIWEDLHWIDPTSLELLDLLLDAIGGYQIFVLATARPNFDYGFGGHPCVTRLSLNRLGREMTSAIVTKLTGGKTLPAELVEIIVDRTDGVPLFVEELTKTILESGAVKEEGGQLVLDGPLRDIAIPATLYDSLLARLDRLQPIKEVAQNAACIGREFKHALLARITSLQAADLTAALDGLISAELIYRRGVLPEASYTFKHALVRDAAYDSLLKNSRKAIHSRVLNALEVDGDAAPELLATHAEAAGQIDRAIDLWEDAAKMAIARPAFSEGTAHYIHAIELLAPKLTQDDQAAMARSLALQTQLSVAYMTSCGWAADETKTSFELALALDDRLNETPMRFSILYGLSVSRYARGELAEAELNGQPFVDVAEAAVESAPAVVANRSFAAVYWIIGDVDRAQPYFDRAIKLFDPEIHLGLANEYGQDLGMATYGINSLNHLWRGQSREGQRSLDKCIHYAEISDSNVSKCYMHLMGQYFSEYTGNQNQFEHHSQQMYVLSHEHDIELFKLYSGMATSITLLDKGDVTGLEAAYEHEARWMANPTKLLFPAYRLWVAKRAFALGMTEDAHALAERSKKMMDETGEKHALVDYYQLSAKFALNDGEAVRAEALLGSGIEVATRQGAILFELRAAIDLATILVDTDRADEARSLLVPVLNKVAEGNCPEERLVATTIIDNSAG